MSSACFGYCIRCNAVHSLAMGRAEMHSRNLMKALEEKKRIDFDVCQGNADPRFSTSYLFGEGRGQMFGVLVCHDKYGNESVLKAFSGQYDGVWEVEGWAPPLFDLKQFHKVNTDREREIKGLTRLIDSIPASSEQRKQLVRKRKRLSQDLMKDIHSLYEITNFRGETRNLKEIVQGGKGIPTGTGDCCAPKLLNFAAKNSLTPIGLVEFFWGMESKSATRHHGNLYDSCLEKCQPILGFILCGLKERENLEYLGES